ncbi:MAG: M15 family metallopeptidase [Oscillospiraceae bacterium]|nr:M15 family metallopeptidase [Oscillospiraceae bacterium]
MKKIIKLTLLFVVLALIITGIDFLGKNPYYLFIAGEHIGVNCDKIEMSAVYPDNIKMISLNELKSDNRVRFDQSAILINSDYPLQEDFVPSLSKYKDTDVQINECLNKAYEKLSATVGEEFGSKLFVSSTYRTQEEQQKLYEEDPSNANAPGTSEHQSGLALDVYVKNYAGLGFIKSDAGRFVNSKCWEYGFIVRYPSYGKEKTGMKYEPWHIRYVGKPHAEIIYNNRLTLEEYIESLQDGAWYEADGYLISRQKPQENDMLSLPANFTNAVISPDNTGSYIITVTC